MKFTNIKIGPRLIAAFSLVLFMLVIVAVLSVTRMSAIQQSMVAITKGNDVESALASAMRLSVDDRLIALRNIVLLQEPGQMQTQIERMRHQAADYDAAEKKLRETFAIYGIQDEERAILEQTRRHATAAQPIMEKIQALGLANNNAEGTRILMKDLREVQLQWQTSLAALINSEKRQNEEATAQADTTYELARNLTMGISVLAIVAGLGVAWLITR
ncbi:MAG: MCP four helix bundle domain-containing protein, partial [Duganella sp.]